MPKYKLKALSVNIGGVLFKKEDKDILDSEGKHKGLAKQLANAEKAGFLEIVKGSKRTEDKNKK